MNPQKIYLVTSAEYHENPVGFGVFTSLENAEACVMQCPVAGIIHVIEIDRIYQEEPRNTHITPTMEGVEVRVCNPAENNFQIG